MRNCTATRIALQLGRNSVGYEMDIELKETILEKNYDAKLTERDEITTRVKEGGSEEAENTLNKGG